MVAISHTAGAMLRQLQTQQPDGGRLRLDVDTTGWLIGASAPQSDDEVVFHEGEPVLRLSAAASAALTGCTITADTSPEGPRLTVLSPADE